ncbi:MAG: hypothetical protein ACJAYN_003046 [Bermanella sp.]|jgi:hypothetical protein|nr:hypothetical protein CXF81_13950 [Glaciecola sp. 33A]
MLRRNAREESLGRKLGRRTWEESSGEKLGRNAWEECLPYKDKKAQTLVNRLRFFLALFAFVACLI